MTAGINYEGSRALYCKLQEFKEETIKEIEDDAKKKAGSLAARVEVLESRALMNDGFERFKQKVEDCYAETESAPYAKMLTSHMRRDICSMSLKERIEDILVAHPFTESV